MEVGLIDLTETEWDSNCSGEQKTNPACQANTHGRRSCFPHGFDVPKRDLSPSGFQLRRPFGSARISTLLQQLGHQGRPAGLMAGAEALAGVAVEIFVEKNEIAPVGVGGKLGHAAVDRAVSMFVPQENSGEAPRDFGGNFGKREPVAGTRRELDFEIVAEVMMELLQRFDEQIVHGKPHRAAPI